MAVSLAVSTQQTNVTDTELPSQAPHDGIGRACAYCVARQKSFLIYYDVWGHGTVRKVSMHAKFSKCDAEDD